jgi:hypothetical protein
MVNIDNDNDLRDLIYTTKAIINDMNIDYNDDYLNDIYI